MADDFRILLKEDSRRADTGERWFEDIEIGDMFFFSVQASALHASTPEALLEDVKDYEAFQVTIQSKHGVFPHGKRGIWQYLSTKPWWGLFEEDTQILYMAERVPAATVQSVYEDLLACAKEHPETVSRSCASKLKAC